MDAHHSGDRIQDGVERFSKIAETTQRRHARTCSGHPRLFRHKQDVDGRDKHGHDAVDGSM
jgi:hypothetical protein